MRADGLAALDNRSREIFRRIVDSYLTTGEPVGSRNVSRILAATLSPASVRNVMADLEDMGLIYSPHTSAGRLPTDFGLRFFIDTLMEVGDLSKEERERIDHEVHMARRRQLGGGGPLGCRPDAFGAVARRRRRARRQAGHPPEARGVRAHRADARARPCSWRRTAASRTASSRSRAGCRPRR